MTIKIEITAETDTELFHKMGVLGFFRSNELRASTAPAPTKVELAEKRHTFVVLEGHEAVLDEAGRATGETRPIEALNETKPLASEAAGEPAPTETASADIDTRLVGEPADGNKRRNSEQKAEDDEFEALASKKGINLDRLNLAIKLAGRAEAKRHLEAQPDSRLDEVNAEVSKDTAKPAISTGEERVSPEDDAAAKQDKADEEAEAAAKSDGSLTHDDLRRAVGAYQKAHGMAAAVRAVAPDGFIGCTIDKVPTEKLAEMIAKVEAATAEAPAKAEPAKTEGKAVEPETKPATRDDLLGAMKAYARKYDGQDSDPAKMTATMADMPKIFQHVFGPGIEKQSQIPDDRLGEAVAAVRAAIDENTFGRDAKNG